LSSLVITRRGILLSGLLAQLSRGQVEHCSLLIPKHTRTARIIGCGVINGLVWCGRQTPLSVLLQQQCLYITLNSSSLYICNVVDQDAHCLELLTGKFLADNIVGSVLVFSLIFWIPFSILVHCVVSH
jgi:hypothetical protein